MSLIEVEAKARALYTVRRDAVQAAADQDMDHQAQVRANLVQRRYYLTWDELSVEQRTTFLEDAVRTLPRPAAAPPSEAEQIAAYKATLPPSYHWREPTQWADPANRGLWTP